MTPCVQRETRPGQMRDALARLRINDQFIWLNLEMIWVSQACHSETRNRLYRKVSTQIDVLYMVLGPFDKAGRAINAFCMC